MTTIHVMLDLETWGKKPGCDLRSIGATVFDPLTGFVAGFDPTEKGSGATFDPGHGTLYIATDNPAFPDHFTNLQRICEWHNDKSGTGTFRKYPLARDPDTVQWWNDQSAEAQAAFANPVDLHVALVSFGDWLHMITADLRPLDNPSQIAGLIDPLTGEADMIDVHAIGVVHDQPRPLHKCDVLCLWSHGPAFDVAILAAAYDAVGLPVPWHYRAPRDTRTAFDIADIGNHSDFMAGFKHGTAHNALDDAISQARCVNAAYQRLRDGTRQAFYDGWNSRDIASPSINAVGLSVHSAWSERSGVSLTDLIGLTIQPPGTLTDERHGY